MNESIKLIGTSQQFKTELIEIIEKRFEITKNGAVKNFTFSIARRPPGVRLMIVKENKILLTKEFRSELENWDYRLPGGKIFETIDDYLRFLESDKEIEEFAVKTVQNEGKEEAGILVKDQYLLYKSVLGSAIEWDLYYYVVHDFTENPSNAPEDFELIHPEWFSFQEALEMCLAGKIKEDRTLGVLTKFLLQELKK